MVTQRAEFQLPSGQHAPGFLLHRNGSLSRQHGREHVLSFGPGRPGSEAVSWAAGLGTLLTVFAKGCNGARKGSSDGVLGRRASSAPGRRTVLSRLRIPKSSALLAFLCPALKTSRTWGVWLGGSWAFALQMQQAEEQANPPAVPPRPTFSKSQCWSRPDFRSHGEGRAALCPASPHLGPAFDLSSGSLCAYETSPFLYRRANAGVT